MSVLRRRSLILPVLIFALLPGHLLAQRGMHGGRTGQANTAGSGAQPDSTDMQDFKRAVELQASTDQITQFQSMAKSVGKALEGTQQFMDRFKKDHATSSDASDLTGEANLFQLVMDDVGQHDHDFFSSFTDPQKSGLKKQVKDVRKAESEASKQWKELEENLKRTPFPEKDAAEKAASLKDALLALQTDQKNLGDEMSIDLSKIPDQPAPQPVLTSR